MPIDDAPADGAEYDLIDPGPSGFGEGVPAAATTDAAAASTPETPTTPEGAAPPAGTDVGQQGTDATAAGAAPSGEQPASGTQVAQAPQLTPEQLQRAAMYGVDPAQLTAFADPERALMVAENVAMKTLIQAAQFQTQQNQQRQVQQAPRPQPPQPPPPFNEVALRKQYADAGYDSTQIDLQMQALAQTHQVLVGQYQLAMRDHQLQDQLWQSSQATQQLQRQMEQQQQLHQADLINRDFADFKKGLEANPQTAPFAKLIGPKEQQAIMAHCDVNYTGMVQRGIQPPANHTLFEQAMYATLGPKMYGAARESVRADVTNHQGRAIARPTSGGTAKLPPGEERAARFADDFWRRAGVQAVGSDGGDI